MRELEREEAAARSWALQKIEETPITMLDLLAVAMRRGLSPAAVKRVVHRAEDEGVLRRDCERRYCARKVK